VSLTTVLGVATALFGVGLYGLLQRRSLVAMLISIELMLASIAINIIGLTALTGLDASVGQVVVLVMVGVAAAETAIALSLFVAVHRAAHTIDVEQLRELKG
jgi:NADH:ubiquinone oxidoreductase subunit K